MAPDLHVLGQNMSILQAKHFRLHDYLLFFLVKFQWHLENI